MKNILFILPILFLGCKTVKTVYVPIETVKTEIHTVHDTTIDVKLDVLRDSVSLIDTLSVLSNKYSISTAKWSNGMLYHSLGIKDVKIPVKIHYVNIETHDSIPYKIETIKEIKVNFLTDWQRFRLKVFNVLLICFSLYIILTFRKGIIGIIRNLIK